MNYNAKDSDVGLDDQHLNITDDIDFSSKDIIALIIASMQIILPFVFGLLGVFGLILLLFQLLF
jgi:hypothetical protein